MTAEPAAYKPGRPIQCIIDRHTGQSSDEHIIPEVLGGRLTVDRVCHDCNNNACAKLDAYLSTCYLVPFSRLRFRTPRWEEAQKIVYGKVLIDDEYHGILHSDLRGKMKFNQFGQPPLIEVDDAGAKRVTLRLNTSNPNKVYDIARRVAAREGLKEPSYQDIVGRIESASTSDGSRKVQFTKNVDLSKLAIAGAKIAYEFAFDTLGEEYLNDEGADSFRNIITEGFGALDRFARGEDVITHGYTWPLGFTNNSRFDAELPPSAHAIVLEREGNVLRVRFRLFDVFEGAYVMTPNGERFTEPGFIRFHYLDVATGMLIDKSFNALERARLIEQTPPV